MQNQNEPMETEIVWSEYLATLEETQGWVDDIGLVDDYEIGSHIGVAVDAYVTGLIEGHRSGL